MRAHRVVVCVMLCVAYAACSNSASASRGDKNLCTSWVAAAVAVNRGSAAGPLAASSEPPDVAGVIADPAYTSSFETVATLASSASDPALRGAATTLQTALLTTANHSDVDQAALRDAMSTLTRRCLEFGFPVPPASSH